MKRTIELRESELKRMIGESVKRVINENILRTPFYKLEHVINEFLEILETEYNVNDGSEVQDAYEALKNAIDKVENLVLHPEGSNGQKIWDNVGF